MLLEYKKREEKMSEVKDPKIKLFGKTIELPEAAGAVPADAGGEVLSQACEAAKEDGSSQDPPCLSDLELGDGNMNVDADGQESTEIQSDDNQDKAKGNDGVACSTPEELKDCKITPPVTEDSVAASAEEDAGVVHSSKVEEDQSEACNSQDKTLKKPDKILPCPRCNSMETKFCYFNNYNVNQPRHFCKNCQRYWTAGGSMRNVPVGAGRRKNKNTASQFRHLTVREALQSSQMDIPNAIHPSALNPNNNTVLTFTSDAPLCESMASVLNIGDKTIINSSRNGFRSAEEVSLPYGNNINLDECLSGSSGGSSTNGANSKDDADKAARQELIPNFYPFVPHAPGFGAPWPFPWNSVQWRSPLSPPTFGPPSFPIPFIPTSPPYWGCAIPRALNAPWIFPPIPSDYQSGSQGSSPNSPTLGKHSRDDSVLKTGSASEETQKDFNSEKSLWIPKTLRIDDPEEAAKSSIWETLGIKHDSGDCVGGVGLFRPLQNQSKKSHVLESSNVLTANPAALSRSLSFQESS